MRYGTPEAFRAALDQRLKNDAATAAALLDPILASEPAQRWDPKVKRWF